MPFPLPNLASILPDGIGDITAARRLFAHIAASPVEVVAVAYLDRQLRVLGMRHVQGSRTAVEMDTRLIAIDALTFHAAGVIMAHNHPSGDAQPSRGDLAAVKRLKRVLDALNVQLLDHLIFGGAAHSSLRAMGML